MGESTRKRENREQLMDLAVGETTLNEADQEILFVRWSASFPSLNNNRLPGSSNFCHQLECLSAETSKGLVCLKLDRNLINLEMLQSPCFFFIRAF